MVKMRVLHKSIVLILLIIVACKQVPKNDVAIEEANTSVVEDQTKTEENTTQQTTQNKEQTIQEFLQQLQIAVKNDDVATIEKSLKFPIEFNWGGESSFYNNYKEVKENNDMFSSILEAESIEKDGDMFIITYQDPEDIEYFVAFIAVKDGDSFKLTSFMQPH